MLPRWKDNKPGELPEVPSVTSLWRTADWHEREVYDLSRRLVHRPSRPDAAFCSPRIGWAIRCARITSFRWNITASAGGDRSRACRSHSTYVE